MLDVCLFFQSNGGLPIEVTTASFCFVGADRCHGRARRNVRAEVPSVCVDGHKFDSYGLLCTYLLTACVFWADALIVD